ncbi:MAG: type VI secretion system baseplate subunit TssG [Thermodesulfobacteriota bacterium]
MAPAKRQPHPSVSDRLFEEWYIFSFFQAVHLLETFSPDKEKLGKTLAPGSEAVRFSVRPGLGFPASDIVRLDPPEEEGGPARMEIAFMGLIGPAGVLPHCYNELTLERVSKKDQTLVAFLNLFHHRLLSLFYLGWKKHQFPVNFLLGARDKLSSYLLSLCGLGTRGLAGRIGFAEESLSYYCGLLSRQIPSGESIRSTVEHFSGAKTEIEQFIQRLIPLDAKDRTRIGMANAALGVDALCGTSIWECQTRFMLILGPMSFADFIRFLPSGDMHGPTFSLIRYIVGVEYEFDVKIILRREEVPPVVLGRRGASASRLGWTSWMKTPAIGFGQDPAITFHEKDAIAA